MAGVGANAPRQGTKRLPALPPTWPPRRPPARDGRSPGRPVGPV